jgi:hypothetical protein
VVFTMSSATCREAAKSLIAEISENVVVDFAEPAELTRLRRRLFTDRERLLEALENPGVATAGYLGLDELFWTARFSWADLQDFVEEANSKLINDERGFRSEWLCVKELADGTIVPDRPRIHRHQTLYDYARWAQANDDVYPISAWDEDDYEAATACDADEEDEAEDEPTISDRLNACAC